MPNVNLYTGANTVCGPPDDTGTSEVSISPGSYTTGAEIAQGSPMTSPRPPLPLQHETPTLTIEPYMYATLSPSMTTNQIRPAGRSDCPLTETASNGLCGPRTASTLTMDMERSRRVPRRPAR